MKYKTIKRLTYGIATLVFLVVEVMIALFVHDSFIRPYIGDALVVIVLYTFIRMFIPEGIKLLPLYIFIFACLIEFLQYIHIVEILELQDNAFFRIIIGSVFDWSDILCYGIGCVVLVIFDWMTFLKKFNLKTYS